MHSQFATSIEPTKVSYSSNNGTRRRRTDAKDRFKFSKSFVLIVALLDFKFQVIDLPGNVPDSVIHHCEQLSHFQSQFVSLTLKDVG